MKGPLRVGIIGCGAIAQLSHIPCILDYDERFTLAAVSDVSASLLKAVADRYRIADRYQDPRDLLARKDIDAVIIPHLIITTPFAIWMIKGFIQEVPRELEEAAMIDGASQLGVLRIVTLPLIAPGLVITALFCFIWSWNDFMFALILTRNAAMTLPVAVSNMREAHGLMWGEVSATASLGTVPIIILAIILQKYLVRGLSLGALK
jgi:ABC-type glycerol-3-phosphate transport system permease component